MLRNHDLHANVIVSNKVNMDILPIRASKGLAIRYIALKWGVPLDNCFVAGDSGNDAGMLIGETLATVVANHSEELDCLRGKPHIYFASQANARGVIEGLNYYHFLDEKILIQDEEEIFNEEEASHSQVFASGK
jgi:sucrose-phosphate synthase